MTTYSDLMQFAFLEEGQDGRVRANSIFDTLEKLLDPRKTLRIYEDFTGGVLSTNSPLTASTTNSGSVDTTMDGDANHVGICRCSTAANAAATAYVGSNHTGMILLGGSTVLMQSAARIGFLSDATDTVTARWGLMDNKTGESVDGVYFRYIHSTYSGRWQTVTRSNSVETVNDSGVAVVAATWQKLMIKVDALGSNAYFYINDTLVQTHTTNIPTAAGRLTGFGASVVKSAGTNSRTIELDYIHFLQQFTTQR